MNFIGMNVIGTDQFDRASIDKVLDTAKSFEDVAQQKEKTDLLRGKILASLFYEPSTRTRLSFETAMFRLGGDVLSVTEAMTSSLSKGETLADTAKVIDQYADVIVVRHSDEGSAEEMAVNCECPVINAGDGANQHPTQSLIDMYTMREECGQIDGLTVAMAGDLKYGRTVHSLVHLLKHYKIKFIFVAPASLQIPDKYLKDIEYEQTDNLEEAMAKSDVLYMTRIQRERFLDKNEYKKYKGVYVLTKRMVLNVNEKIKILHPLPRVDEIAKDVDELKNACYFRQVQNGVTVRMALLALVLGKA
ncbi:MAG: aspartate carbamoyltransferase [Patescibacteria group bacterium]|nr:aspartate carbamoyltransferase [Patescibacteria group bacterium]